MKKKKEKIEQIRAVNLTFSTVRIESYIYVQIPIYMIKEKTNDNLK